MPPNPPEKQKDVGQFNAWLKNIGQTRMPAPPDGGHAPSSPRPAFRPPAPSGGGILGEIDSEIDDVFGRIVSDAPPPPVAPPPQAAPRPAPVQTPPAPRPEAPKSPPSRADVDRLIAATHAQQRPEPAATTSPPRQSFAPPPPVQPQSVFGRPVAPQQQAQQPPAAPALPAQLAQFQLQHQQELARVEQSFLETKNQLQKQVKDIQLKYQEQRTKWENVLADLRIRNDELLRRNQELEQQIGQMSERHRELIQEYTELRGQTLSGQPAHTTAQSLPEEIGAERGQILKGEFQIPDVAVPTIDDTAVRIDMPMAQAAAEPARLSPEVSFQMPGEEPALPPTAAESDDLLAELDALEKEMKDIGGN